ncbi:hypothetical protein NKH77_54095 [Streptomyces sp. M19]
MQQLTASTLSRSAPRSPRTVRAAAAIRASAGLAEGADEAHHRRRAPDGPRRPTGQYAAQHSPTRSPPWHCTA